MKLPLIQKATARLLSEPKFQGLRDDMAAWRKWVPHPIGTQREQALHSITDLATRR